VGGWLNRIKGLTFYFVLEDLDYRGVAVSIARLGVY